MKDELTPDEVIAWLKEMNPKPSPAPCDCQQCLERRAPKPEPERVWPCFHIGKITNDYSGPWFFCSPGIDFGKKQRDGLVNADAWLICPLCHAKRPAEKPRTLAERLRNCFIREDRPEQQAKVAEKEAIEWFREKAERQPNCDCANIRCQEGCLNKHNLLREIEP